MLGLSTKVSRTELLTAKKTGIAREFSDWVQEKVLDHGHAVEALARPIIEGIINADFYPVTASNEDIGGKQSASCDGLTIDRKLAFEHKQWSDSLAAAVRAKQLPEEYMPQCQQICKITGAKEVIFTVSDGTESRMEYMVVPADPAWFERLDAGWAQFEQDLASHIPAPAEVKPVGATPETLPALFVELTGAVTNSNLDAYKDHALAVIGSINRNLQTDQDFADASKAVRWCGDVESRLEAVKQHALSQTKTIDELFKTIDDIKAKAKETRLDLGKLVDRRNTERKEEIVLGAKSAYQAHVDSLKAETEGLWVALPIPDFAGAIKGMRLFANMQDAVNTLLANSKIAADESAKKIRANLALLADASEYAFLFNDRAHLISKAQDDLKLLIQSRISDHKNVKAKEEEATRERIRAEEQAKAEKDAREKLAAEQETAKKAERERIAAEAAKVQRIVTGIDVAPVPSHTTPALPQSVVPIMPTEVQRVFQSEQPTLKLGQIGERLGFGVTADFLRGLGFEPAAQVKNASLFHESDFPLICNALIAHIEEVSEKHEAVAA
jgi:predicted phage-related endonuclease